MVLWLIGMSGSGKTTVAEYMYKKLKKRCKNLVLIDGDVLRQIMGNDLGHTVEDRSKNAHRITRLCKFLDSQGINVICAVLSIFHESHEWNRANIKDYFEVFIDTPFNTLVKRDPKGYYKKALKGELKHFVGVDIPFPKPLKPDLVLNNNGTKTLLYKETDKLIRKVRRLIK